MFILSFKIIAPQLTSTEIAIIHGLRKNFFVVLSERANTPELSEKSAKNPNPLRRNGLNIIIKPKKFKNYGKKIILQLPSTKKGKIHGLIPNFFDFFKSANDPGPGRDYFFTIIFELFLG